MRITAVGAEYFLKLSTGNYGSEEWRVGIQAMVEEGESAQAIAAELQEIVTDLVERRLLKSRFRAVREAVAAVEADANGDLPF